MSGILVASHRAGTIAVADLINRVRRALRAPNANASHERRREPSKRE